MKIVYLICPVRNVDEETSKKIEGYVYQLEHGVVECIGKNHIPLPRTDIKVHYPPRDVNQDCDTGVSIVNTHAKAMRECDEVHVIWDSKSSGSHFDLGMAIALGKPLVKVWSVHEDTDGKSYDKVLTEYSKAQKTLGII